MDKQKVDEVLEAVFRLLKFKIVKSKNGLFILHPEINKDEFGYELESIFEPDEEVDLNV